jgi:hypothetical protein
MTPLAKDELTARAAQAFAAYGETYPQYIALTAEDRVFIEVGLRRRPTWRDSIGFYRQHVRVPHHHAHATV